MSLFLYFLSVLKFILALAEICKTILSSKCGSCIVDNNLHLYIAKEYEKTVRSVIEYYFEPIIKMLRPFDKIRYVRDFLLLWLHNSNSTYYNFIGYNNCITRFNCRASGMISLKINIGL